MFRPTGGVWRAVTGAAGLLTTLALLAGWLLSGGRAEAKLAADSARINSPNFSSSCHGAVRLVDSPNVGNSDNQLTAVAMAPRMGNDTPDLNNRIWAVGYYLNSIGVPQTLIEHWSDNAWQVVSSPNVGSNRNYLNAVAVAGPNNVWAVGFYWDANNVQRTLVEHWDGSTWNIVSSPNVGPHENYLDGIAVAGPNSIWAVGLYSPDTYGYNTLAMHWDGSQWSVVSTPNMQTRDNYLVSVSIARPNDIWAVGYYSETRADQKTLTMHWDGTSWTIVSSPNVGNNRNYLNSVAVAAPSDAWAVGFYWNSSNVQRTLTEHWNGKSWTVVQTPDVGVYENYLNSVSVGSPHDVWAVGLYSPDTVRYLTVVLHWDGTAWNVVQSPDAGTRDNYLNGVVAAANGEMWTVGYSRNTGAQENTLIEHYSCRP